jgi:hypothetical protein
MGERLTMKLLSLIFSLYGVACRAVGTSSEGYTDGRLFWQTNP